MTLSQAIALHGLPLGICEATLQVLQYEEQAAAQQKKSQQGAAQATADELLAEEAGSQVHSAKETKKQKAQLAISSTGSTATDTVPTLECCIAQQQQ
ncbi:TPA: hypothetical protein ACH3X1_012690 [Trebouxia sp. C0004]